MQQPELTNEQIDKIENAYLEALKQAPAEFFIGMATEGLKQLNELRNPGDTSGSSGRSKDEMIACWESTAREEYALRPRSRILGWFKYGR